jgi:fermentation-respiration switch protein FrsA (DUF1100 family)
MEGWMGMLVNLAGMSIALYVVVVGAAWLGQRHLMYVPNATRVAPAAAGLAGVQEQVLAAPDGARLIAWHTPARAGRPTLLYLHGNAGNLAGRADRFERYQRLGFGLMMLSWRGYSGSTGNPTEANNVADATLAFDTLVESGVPAHDIVVYGESLGSGVAIQLAGARPVAALVLDAPYTSIVDVAILSYPYLPVRPLLLDRYESDRHIAKVTAPVLVLHGERDTVIPVTMGRALYERVPGPKKIALFPEGGHIDLDSYGAVEIVAQWIAETLGKVPDGSTQRPDIGEAPRR